MSKTPPWIYTQNENRRRLTRSIEDLSNKYLSESMYRASLGQTVNSSSPSRFQLRTTSKTRTQSPHIHEDAVANNNIERSVSLHSNVLKSPNQIFLPKDYNPIAAITAVENMEIFLSKTFYNEILNKLADIAWKVGRMSAACAAIGRLRTEERRSSAPKRIDFDVAKENDRSTCWTHEQVSTTAAVDLIHSMYDNFYIKFSRWTECTFEAHAGSVVFHQE